MRRLRDWRLERLVDRFLSCADWAGAERLVASRPRHEALALLASWEEKARSDTDHTTADTYEYHRLLLERCRGEGPARVFGELTADDPAQERWEELVEAALDALDRAAGSGHRDDLDTAVDHCERAADRCVTAPQRAVAYGHLGVALLRRADRVGSAEDVGRAVGLLDTVYALTPPSAPERLDAVTNLAWALELQHRVDRHPATLDRVAELLRRVIEREEPPDPDGPWPSGARDADMLTSLASVLRTQYFATGSPADLADAVVWFERAVQHDGRSARALGNLGVALSDFFGCTGSVRDLRRAEECLRKSLAWTDAHSPERPARLAHLASVLADRYVHEGRDSLDEAVALYTEAERAAPPGSPEHAAHSSGLGTALLTRHERHGDLADLREAVRAHGRAATAPGPERDDEALYLDQWGTSLRLSARRLDDAAEAHRAVGLHGRAVALTGDGSPDLPLRQGNLAAALRLHAELTGDRASLERSVEVHEQVRRTVGEKSPYTAAVLTNRAAALRASARRTGQRAPLDEAIVTLRRAVRATAPDAPELAGRLSELGHALADRGQSGDAAEAVRAYREGCRLAAPDNVPVRLVAGRAWGAWAARREAHEEAAEAFDHAVDAVDVLVRTQLTRPTAEIWLARATEVAAEAAHAHAAAGAPAQAVLRLERGRARLLTAALRTGDTDLRRLRGTDPDLAERFRRAAARLHGLEHAAPPRDPEHGGSPPAP
ncbi:hypothetical protein [Streptomyces adelaidensis]|uniref:hypothetical protein n=1 Tax=Streptomyces adelaidensis TaxID=2796465 RepID=UPI0019045933|nr:hypothetical protein [Streptomyces adelaidensis]